MGQKNVLIVTCFKTKSVRPTETRVPNHNDGWCGHSHSWGTVLKHGGILGACFKTVLQLRRPCLQRREWFGTDQQGAHTGAHIQSVSRNAARVGSPRPDTIMATTSALSGPLTGTVAPGRHGCHSMSQSTPTTEVTPRAHIARLGLVTKRCLEVPPERIEGGSLWPGRALERQSA